VYSTWPSQSDSEVRERENPARISSFSLPELVASPLRELHTARGPIPRVSNTTCNAEAGGCPLSTPLYIRESVARGIHYCGARHGCTGCLLKYPCKAPSVRARITMDGMQAWGSWCGAAISRACSSHIARLQPQATKLSASSANTCNYCRSHERPTSQCAGAVTEGEVRQREYCSSWVALTVVDVESNGFAFADMAATRKSARAGRGGCWLALFHSGTVYRIRGCLF
jgi:hypothetical protein